jgi:hypothetical protein
MKKKYFGKRDPREESAAPEPAKTHPWDAIFSARTASLSLAWHILGVTPHSSMVETRAAFRKLTLENHPDRGGDEKMFKHINCAWSYLRISMGW